MTFREILTEELITEQNNDSLLLLDVDDTLIKPKNIYIYKQSPNEDEEKKLTPEEFAREDVEKEQKQGVEYDFRDFRDPDKLAQSIKTGLPIVSNLKLMDRYIQNGWKIGILTARGMEDVMADTMKAWLKFRDAKGRLKKAGPKLVRDLVFAVNDDTKDYKGDTSFEKKLNVIKKLKDEYKRIVLIDDDQKNLDAVREWIEKNNIQNVAVKEAKA